MVQRWNVHPGPRQLRCMTGVSTSRMPSSASDEFLPQPRLRDTSADTRLHLALADWARQLRLHVFEDLGH